MSKSNPHNRVLLLASTGVALACLFTGGCGSSPRSDFYDTRDVVATPIAGTGEALGEEMASLIAVDSAAFASADANRQLFGD